MKRKFWNTMRAAAPLALILPGFSFSQIPAFFTSSELKVFVTQVITQVAIGVADVAIEIAVQLAFGVI